MALTVFHPDTNIPSGLFRRCKQFFTFGECHFWILVTQPLNRHITGFDYCRSYFISFPHIASHPDNKITGWAITPVKHAKKSERLSNGSCGDSVRAPMAPQNTTKISAQHVSPVIFQSSLPTICHIVNAATLTVSRPVHAQYPMETQTESRSLFSHGKAFFFGWWLWLQKMEYCWMPRGRRQRIR